MVLIHKPRPTPLKLARGCFYALYNPSMQIYYFLFRPHVKGVKSFIFRDGKILLVRIGYSHGGWVLPGGAVDRGETAVQAAGREVEEESGVLVRGLKFVCEREVQREYKKVHLSYFYGETEEEDIVIDDQEIVDAGWFAVDNLPSPRRAILDDELKMCEDWKYNGKH